jgi:hypothetical protein
VTADAAHVAAVAEALAVEAASQGMGPGGSIHGWRCEYPDRYGPCDCIAEVSADLATVAVETLTPLIRAQVAAEIRAAEVLSPFSPISDPTVRAYNLGARQALDTAARIAEATP